MASNCLLITKLSSGPVYVDAYVDDLLIFGNKKNVEQVKKKLATLFTITDLGKWKYFLGIENDCSPRSLFLSQEAYIERFIQVARMANSKLKKTLQPLRHKLYEALMATTDANRRDMRKKPYRKALGALLYFPTRTTPDISITVSLLSKLLAGHLHSFILAEQAPGRSQPNTLEVTPTLGEVSRSFARVLISLPDQDWSSDT